MYAPKVGDAASEPRRCEVCGDPIRFDNKYGVCTNGSKPACIEARRRKRPQRAPESRPEISRRREVCGRPINRNNQFGICGRPDSPECVRERGQRKREGFAADLGRLVIAAGEVFGNWTALESYATQNHYVLCRCACGTLQRVPGSNLVSGWSRGCRRCATASMVKTRFSDPYIPAGAIFGRLTVLEDVPRCGGRALCRCACGREKKDVSSQGLKNGSIRSCGCLSQERRSKLGGFSKHPLYPIWNGIIDRCTDPRNPSYGNYGGRGITVCERWRDQWLFVADIESEIGPRPEGTYKNGRALYSLDRKDNNGNYEPGNVQWSTTSQQVINQRKVAKMTLELDAMARKLDMVTRERNALAAELQALKASLP